jgi:hypothetical protein
MYCGFLGSLYYMDALKSKKVGEIRFFLLFLHVPDKFLCHVYFLFERKNLIN